MIIFVLSLYFSYNSVGRCFRTLYGKRFFGGSKAVKDHAGDQVDPAHDDHVVCPSCELEKSLILSFGGDDMKRFYLVSD